MTTTSPHLCTPFARELSRALKAQGISKRQFCVRLGHQRAGWLSDTLRRVLEGAVTAGEIRALVDSIARPGSDEAKRLDALALRGVA
jgi:hypothetical protein